MRQGRVGRVHLFPCRTPPFTSQHFHPPCFHLSHSPPLSAPILLLPNPSLSPSSLSTPLPSSHRSPAPPFPCPYCYPLTAKLRHLSSCFHPSHCIHPKIRPGTTLYKVLQRIREQLGCQIGFLAFQTISPTIFPNCLPFCNREVQLHKKLSRKTIQISTKMRRRPGAHGSAQTEIDRKHCDSVEASMKKGAESTENDIHERRGNCSSRKNNVYTSNRL